MKKNRLILVIIFLSLRMCNAFSDSEMSPSSYKMATKDDKHVFVMRAPYGWKFVEDVSFLKYPKSGLYYKDGYAEPLWTIDWYAHTVYLSSDGKYLVRPGPWARLKDSGEPNLEELAVAFYENGKLLKSYSVADLVSDLESLVLSVSHYMWSKDEIFDDKLNQLTIITLSDDKYVFDVNTGELLVHTKEQREKGINLYQ